MAQKRNGNLEILNVHCLGVVFTDSGASSLLRGLFGWHAPTRSEDAQNARYEGACGVPDFYFQLPHLPLYLFCVFLEDTSWLVNETSTTKTWSSHQSHGVMVRTWMEVQAGLGNILIRKKNSPPKYFCVLTCNKSR